MCSNISLYFLMTVPFGGHLSDLWFVTSGKKSFIKLVFHLLTSAADFIILPTRAHYESLGSVKVRVYWEFCLADSIFLWKINEIYTESCSLFLLWKLLKIKALFLTYFYFRALSLSYPSYWLYDLCSFPLLQTTKNNFIV